MVKQNSSSPIYHLTLFKIAGHATWRAHLVVSADGFKEQVEGHAKVTEKKVFVIERLMGKITEKK